MALKIHPRLVLWGVRMGFVSYGWDAGVLGGVLQTSAFQTAMKAPDTTTTAMIVASFLLASWLGCCIAASPWSDRQGRRVWVMVGAALQIVGTVVSCTAYSTGQLIAGRVLIGVGNGFVVSTGPVYIAETAGTAEQRGPLVGILMGCACIGTACAYWIDFGFTYASGQVIWRFPVAFQIFWSLLTLVLVFPNADSPRWYFLRNRPDEGRLILGQIYNDEATAERVASEIKTELHQEVGEKLRFSDFFIDKSETKAATRIRDGVILVGVAYLMGINMIFYYMTTIFQVYIGLPPSTSSVCSGAATTLLAIGSFVGSIYCEKGGRRKWLLWGSALQSIFMILFVALLAVNTKRASAAAAAMLFGWILVFSPTWAPLPYIYVSETMPLRHRHTGVGLSMSAQWLMAFLTVYAGPIGFEKVGWKIWIWFLVFNVIGFPYVYFFLRESRGRSLERMNELYNEKLVVGDSSNGSVADADGGAVKEDVVVEKV
ncbi:sugar transporter-like protein [Aaosphaeria arxii CBS 175.79]|uniref:Sugar transporter-like protein n=1 Tax=Aaosphaeria arxii CBS 175.79 TaxID=1450172 RepID=A0A6A5XU61_9PLEO|nr:sugar transporter-like protein [Aaosphaeria arxii CBS 175.79]KAF2015784.1 sugar transporter-like protein [Aaosphaeria arxii CBS 175.79]